MSAKQESCNKTASVKNNVPRRELQHEPRIIKISGDRTINFVLTNVTDKNVLHINYNNEPKCDVVDMLEGLKIN